MTKTNLKISRKWAMPNLRTFQILPIQDLIKEYTSLSSDWLDLFPYPYQMDAMTLMNEIDSFSVSRVLFDPPYSPRQLKECYDSLGLPLHNTTSNIWASWKDEIARIIRPGGICISFGWSTNGIGKKRGFEIIEILLVAHGGNHNDTIAVVEKKCNKILPLAVNNKEDGLPPTQGVGIRPAIL